MNTVGQHRAKSIRSFLAVAAIAAAYAAPAAAALPFSQTAGWFRGAPTAVISQGFTPLAGGVDFFGPLPANPVPPANTFSTIGWGCSDAVLATSCAAYNGGGPWPLSPATAALATVIVDPFGQAGRSALRVTGGSGDAITGLDFAPVWRDVTNIDHFNHVIHGNVLETAQVRSFLRINNIVVDTGGGPSVTNIDFAETPNDGLANCTDQPAPSAPANPLGTNCDDFAFVSGLDLSPFLLTPTLGVKFRLDALANSGALVCPGVTAGQPGGCGSYDGTDGILIYTAEDATNHFSIQAQLFEITPQNPLPLFVIGDCEWAQWRPHSSAPGDENNLREVTDIVNFWGSQWWKNNCMSLFVDNGYPAFKGFATNVDLTPVPTHPCGQWQARPGNSGHPPDAIATDIAVIVTDNVIKQGPNIGGNIKQIVLVHRDPAVGDNYAGNPGHQGWGTITQILCAPS